MEHGIFYHHGRSDRTGKFLGGLGLLVWFAVVVLPLGWLYLSVRAADLPTAEVLPASRYIKLLGHSLGSAALIATISLLAGWPAGRLMGASRWARQWGPLLLLVPLLIPPHVLYYSLGLLLLPTSRLGMALSQSETVIAIVQAVRSVFSLALWYWPLSGLILGMGWRRTDPDVWLQSSLDSDGLRRWWEIGLPMLRGVLVLAWLLVFMLALSQYGVFLLSAVDTVGTELGVLYQLTGNVHTVAWAALPLVAPAAITAVAMDRFLRPTVQNSDLPGSERCWRGHWVIAGVFWLISTVVPVTLLAAHVQAWDSFIRLSALIGTGLMYSTGIALGAAVLAVIIAISMVVQSQSGGQYRAAVMRMLTFLVALLPGSLVAVALVYTFNRGWLASSVYNRPWIISLGHAAQLGVPAVLMLRWVETNLPAQLGELARLDGARGWAAAVHIWLPGLWPAILAAMLLTVVLSVTEVSATMVLLPAGVPNFAQDLLNQMHYARDQQVIASCLLLIICGVTAAVVLFGLLRLSRWRGSRVAVLLAVCVVMAGCDQSADDARRPNVVGCFGTTGRGAGQFIYPRGVAVAADDTFFVVDKTARIQHLTREGHYLGGWTMPQSQVGKPIGMRCGDGKLYVADTHYHRVMVYTFDGKLVQQFGEYGTGPGQFIYPTDVELAPDGRIFVSEYGGNDRISVFTPAGKFITAFGSPGEAPNQFSRPAALCLDVGRKVLYVADACNHRIVRYDLAGKLLGTMGGVGTLAGQLRYPYDVSLLKDGTLLVAEYGGSRIQRFSPDGKCLGIFGRSGREPGELFYPWGAGTDSHGRLIVVDSGNNRIQVWQIL